MSSFNISYSVLICSVNVQLFLVFEITALRDSWFIKAHKVIKVQMLDQVKGQRYQPLLPSSVTTLESSLDLQNRKEETYNLRETKFNNKHIFKAKHFQNFVEEKMSCWVYNIF